MIKGESLIGKKFGKLVVIEHISGKAKTKSRFLCLCECGRKKELSGSYLPYGRALSCGCSRRNNVRKNGQALVWYSYRKHAKRRNLDFHLTREVLEKLIDDNCFYCGMKETNKTYAYKKISEKDAFYHNGIDRKDNSKGYTLENSVSCCKLCNHMKWNLSMENWIKHMKLILNKKELTSAAV